MRDVCVLYLGSTTCSQRNFHAGVLKYRSVRVLQAISTWCLEQTNY